MKNKQGFTLIELLVVVLIIGILAASATTQYQKSVIRSRYSSLKAIARAIANAQEIYYLANGTYTIKLDELAVNIPGITREIDQGGEGTTFQFNEGTCTLWDTYVQCNHNKVSVVYGIFYQNAYVHPGKQLCRSTDRALDFLCQQDSGTTTYSGDENKRRWYW